jgi:hypothetical protein
VLRTYHQHGRLLDTGTRNDAETSAARAWLADTLDGQRSLLLVDTNDQAARLSASLRTELVRLGRVAEDGVWLGRQGVVAGVGDLVQARRNAWHLAGLHGNRRGPINRETYRVTTVRDDGSIEVTTDTTDPAPDGTAGEAVGDGVGQRLVLPASYVAEDLALGYATTVHAAQGTTVDTTHSVITPSTSAAALYVGMSRGRGANTAHVTTRTAPDDPADGTSRHELHRDPVAVLAVVLDGAETALSRSALAVATESADRAASTRTAAELLADAAQLAATERTRDHLDHLVADGSLTGEQRARIAAEDGAASLTRVLRRAELAGLDPRAVLADAVDRGPLTGSRNLTNVLYVRIRDAHRFDPVGDTWAEWTPRTDNTEWSDYLTALARAADDRAFILGRDAAADPPAWATTAFGDCPAEADQRDEWCVAVGRVAAYREMRGHTSDDGDDVLGPAPKPGQVEEFAAYRAAWRTLGRPEIDREHLELSNGQLRARVRAYDRELAAAPRYVANELAGTRQSAATHQQTAALRRAEADTLTDPGERQRILDEAMQAAALAAVLNARADQLQQIDDARATWLAHTAQTRVQAELSKAELSARDADDDPNEQVTAAEWKAAHDAAMDEEDAHREISEADVAVDDDLDDAPPPQDDAEVGTGWDDVREQVQREPRPGHEDVVRVPDAAETTGHLDHAGRILDEIRYRDTGDDLARAEELNRWHIDDQAAEDDDTDAPVDEYSNGW